jgi:hypothetical protein
VAISKTSSEPERRSAGFANAAHPPKWVESLSVAAVPGRGRIG